MKRTAFLVAQIGVDDVDADAVQLTKSLAGDDVGGSAISDHSAKMQQDRPVSAGERVVWMMRAHENRSAGAAEVAY